MKAPIPTIKVIILSIITSLSISCYADNISDLMKYSRKGDLTNIKSLIDKGVDINSSEDKRGNTALIAAVSAKQYATIEYLVSQGANVNFVSESGYTALHIATIENDILAIKILCSNEANLNNSTKKGFTPLFIAFLENNENLFDLLVKEGADINARINHNGLNLRYGKYIQPEQDIESQFSIVDKSPGNTILHNAVAFNDIDGVKYLLRKGADIEIRNCNGYTPLCLSASIGNSYGMMKLLIENGGYVNAISGDKKSPLSHAELSGFDGIAKLLKKHGAWTSSHHNTKRPSWLNMETKDEVEKFVSGGGNINERDENGQTLLHWLAYKTKRNTFNDPFLSNFSVSYSHEDFLESLVNNKIDFSVTNINGDTPLHYACSIKNVDKVKFFLENGIDPNVKNKNMISPMHVLCQNPGTNTSTGFSTANEEQIIELMLEHGADINIKDYMNQTPFHYVAFNNSKGKHVPFAHFLINKGADIHVRDLNFNTPLHLASWNSSKMVKFLLESGADPDAVNANGYSPYGYAKSWNKREMLRYFSEYYGIKCIFLASEQGSISSIKRLVKGGAKINSFNNSGASPLQLACYNGQLEAVKLLIELGADINLKNKYGVTPLFSSIAKNNLDVIKVLLENNALANILTSEGSNSLGLAYFKHQTVTYDLILEKYPNIKPQYKNITSIKEIRNKTRELAREWRYASFNYDQIFYQQWSKESKSPLHQAIIWNKRNDVNRLIAEGTDVNGFDAKGRTPLVCAVFFDNEDMVNLLLYNEADVNLLDEEFGHSALHRAADLGHAEIIDLLLDNGANVNIKAKDGRTPLHIAIGAKMNDAMPTLLERGAEVDAVDNNGRTPLMDAVHAMKPHQIKYLIDHGADIKYVDNDGNNLINMVLENWSELNNKHIEMIANLIDLGVGLDVKDKSGRDFLHIAVDRQSIPFIKLLLKKGFDVNSKDNNGNMPIHTNTNAFHARQNSFEIISLLVEYEADVNTPDAWENTPLLGAVKLKRLKDAELLIKKGAEVNFPDKWKDTPLHIAVKNKNYDIVKLLLENGANPKIENRYKKTAADTIKDSTDEINKKILYLLAQY